MITLSLGHSIMYVPMRNLIQCMGDMVLIRDGICPADVSPGNPGPGTPISREFPGTREIYDI